MSLDSEDAGNAVFLGNRRIDMSGRKYKLRKTDGQISEVFNSNLIKVFIGSRSLVNTVLSSGYKVFGAFFIHRRVIVLVWRLLAAAVYLVKAAAAVARWTRKILAGKPCGA